MTITGCPAKIENKNSGHRFLLVSVTEKNLEYLKTGEILKISTERVTGKN